MCHISFIGSREAHRLNTPPHGGRGAPSEQHVAWWGVWTERPNTTFITEAGAPVGSTPTFGLALPRAINSTPPGCGVTAPCLFFHLSEYALKACFVAAFALLA